MSKRKLPALPQKKQRHDRKRQWISSERNNNVSKFCNECLNTNLVDTNAINDKVQCMINNVCRECGERWSSILTRETKDYHLDNHVKLRASNIITLKRNNIHDIQQMAYSLYLEDFNNSCEHCGTKWTDILEKETKDEHLNEHFNTYKSNITKKHFCFTGIPKSQRQSHLKKNKCVLNERMLREEFNNSVHLHKTFNDMSEHQKITYLSKSKDIIDNDEKYSDSVDTLPYLKESSMFRCHTDPSAGIFKFRELFLNKNCYNNTVIVANKIAANHVTYTMDINLSTQTWGTDLYLCFKCKQKIDIDFQSNEPTLKDCIVCSCTKEKPTDEQEQIYFATAVLKYVEDKDVSYSQYKIAYNVGDDKNENDNLYFLYMINDFFFGFAIHKNCCNHG